MKKILLFVLVLTIPLACNKSDISPETLFVSAHDLTVEEAKGWYENNLKSARNTGNDEKAIWQDAVQKKVDANRSIVTVPIVSFEKQIGYKSVNDNSGKKKKDDDNFISADVKRNLVILKIDDKIESMELRIIRDDDYYLKKGKIKMESKDFDGQAYLFDSEDKMISGVTFQDGKVVSSTSNGNKRGRTMLMIPMCTDWYQQTTVNGEVVAGWVFTHRTCESVDVGGGSGGPGGFGLELITSAFQGAIGGGGSESLSSMLSLGFISETWNNLNDLEKEYFTNNWWLLPGASISYLEANSLVDLFYCNNSDNGNWNAFKHAVWSALLSENLGPRRALEITNIHEEGDNASFQKQKDMDNHNNGLGINTYKSIKSILNLQQSYAHRVATISGTIMNLIETGAGQRISPVSGYTQESELTIYPSTSANRCR